MGRDRHSKSTERFDEHELQRLARSTAGRAHVHTTPRHLLAKGSDINAMPIPPAVSPKSSIEMPPIAPPAAAVELEPDLAAESARRRAANNTAPLSHAELDAVSTAAHRLATGHDALDPDPLDPLAIEPAHTAEPAVIEAPRRWTQDTYVLVTLAIASIGLIALATLLAVR